MGRVIFVRGGFAEVKAKLMTYCLDRFDKEELWLMDSLQVFDPYTASRVDVGRARLMLCRIRVSRPFTLHQLKDKVFSLTRVRLSSKSTIIISGIDCFEDGLDDDEKAAHNASIAGVLKRLVVLYGCRLIIGCSPDYFTGRWQDGKDDKACEV